MSTETKPTPTDPRNSPLAVFLGLLLISAMFIVARFVAVPSNLVLVMLIFFVFYVTLGVTIQGDWCGVLVNDLNVMSLARFQAAGWTLVVLSSYLVYVALRFKNDAADPLLVKIDPHLWALLGISTSSLVGSALITSVKKGKELKDSVDDVALKTSLTSGDTLKEVKDNRQGTLYGNTKKSDAKFTDLFQGDELANTTHIDLGKVQMFFFTVVALGTFALSVAKAIQDSTNDLGQLPVVSEGLVALLGISHAGYLGNKSITHTPVKQP